MTDSPKSSQNPKTRIYRTFDRKASDSPAGPSSVKKVSFQNTRPSKSAGHRNFRKDQSHSSSNSFAKNNSHPRKQNSGMAPTRPSQNRPRPKRSGGHSRRGKMAAPGNEGLHETELKNPIAAQLPPIEKGVIRVIPICGVEWIGTNMTAIEYEDDIIVIDAGFGFKNPDTPGISYTIPDVTYLEQNKHKIKALVITHGHMDHVGGIPYVIERLGMPKIYTREFGALFIKKRMEEFPHVPKLDIHTIDPDADYLTLTPNLKVKFFGLTHSIPDSTGVIIQTPFGGIVSTGDVRIENTDGVPAQEEVDQYAFFKNENILLATIDSTGAPVPGWATSEMLVRETIDKMIKDVSGRLLIAAFSSQVERLLCFLDSAKKYGRYVVIDGRSMKANLGIAEFLKLGNFDHIIPIEDIEKYPPHKLLILVTGGQGEQYSSLQRIGLESHKHITLNPSDTVILSSSVVPGNDFSVDKLKDDLYSSGAKIITYSDNAVHASGHGKREELRWIHNQIPYKFFMPVHGRQWFLRMHARLAVENGTPEENIVIPENGSVIEIYENGTKIRKLKQKVVQQMYVVDGTYIGPLQPVVMDDRKTLGENGMFIVVATVDGRTRQLVKTPDIVSRGFVYLRESKELLSKVRTLIKKTCESYLSSSKEIEIDDFKKNLADKVYKYIVQKTQKEPILIPVIVIV